MATKIVPHHGSKGIDILGARYTRIIRSDLNCYMEVTDLHKGDDSAYPQTIFPLHPSCSGGDHYFAFMRDPLLGLAYSTFFIVKGDQFRAVQDLTTDSNARTGTLHPKCRGGDFYLATSKGHIFTTSPIFLIVFSESGTFRVVSDLTTAKPSIQYKDVYGPADSEDNVTYTLHENCKGGLYYWSTKGLWTGEMWYCILKQDNEWGVQYHCTKDLHTDEEGSTKSIHPSMTSFLPGGLAVNMGPTYGRWEVLKIIDNSDGTVATGWSRDITKTVGYKRSVVDSLQFNWKITTGYSTEATAGMTVARVFTAACNEQFSFSTEHGGQKVDTTEEDWSEESEIEERLNLTVSPGKSVYIWQYRLGMEKEGEKQEVLLTPYVKQTDSKEPPTDAPLPSSHGDEAATNT